MKRSDPSARAAARPIPRSFRWTGKPLERDDPFRKPVSTFRDHALAKARRRVKSGYDVQERLRRSGLREARMLAKIETEPLAASVNHWLAQLERALAKSDAGLLK